MLRSVRLVLDDLYSEYGQFETDDVLEPVMDGYLRLHEGDIMTGWEIIAGLPVETQRNIYLEETVKRSGNCASVRAFRAVLNSGKIFLNSLYRWNGDAWEVVE